MAFNFEIPIVIGISSTKIFECVLQIFQKRVLLKSARFKIGHLPTNTNFLLTTC